MPTSPSAPTEETGLPDSQALPPETTSDVPITGQNEHRAWDRFWSLVGNAGSYALLSSSVVAAALSFACVAVILLLYSARVFTPANAHVVRPLYFDFTQPQAEATVNLLGAEPYTHYIHDLHELRAKGEQQPSGRRFVAPGERLRVWLKLDMDDDDQPADLFQVIGELRTLTGKPVARSSQPCIFHPEMLLHRLLRLGAWPLGLAGLVDLRPSLRVDLFRTYTEKASAPFVEFRAVLHARAGGHPPPPVTAAELHVRLRLGPVRWLLSWFHLRTLPAVLVYLAAGSMSLVFGAASLFLFALWWATGKRRGKPDQAVARPDSVELSDDSEVDVDGASVALSLGSEDDRESNIASSAAAPARVTDRWLADAGRNRVPFTSGSLPPSSVTAASEIGEDTSESAVTVAAPSSLIPAVHRNGTDQSSEARQSKSGFGAGAGRQAAGASLSRRRAGNIGGH